MRVALFLIVVLATATALSHDEERQEMVNKINAMNPGWVAGVTPRFAGQPIGISKSVLGVKANNKAIRLQARKEGRIKMMPPVSAEVRARIPASFDSATNWPQCARVITDIRDQSNCGCCWAFAAASAASDRLCIGTNGTMMIPLSSQEMCFCASPDGCQGGDLTTPWSYIQTNGLSSGAGQGNGTFDAMGFCSAFSLPHCHHHGPQGQDPYPAENTPGCPSESSPSCPTSCDSSSLAPHNNFASDKYTFQGSVANFPDVATIQNSLMTDGPIEVAFTVYSDFENYASGIYKHVSGDELGGHAVKLVGWGTENGVDYWKIQNSWNPYWGEKGHFRIVRGTDECGIEDDATASSNGATWGHM